MPPLTAAKYFLRAFTKMSPLLRLIIFAGIYKDVTANAAKYFLRTSTKMPPLTRLSIFRIINFAINFSTPQLLLVFCNM